MSFYHDSSGVETGSAFKLLPDGQWFPFKIVEATESKSKTGNDMVKCICEVVDDPTYAGTTVWHYVTFLPKESKGAFISVQFRKAIGQPTGAKDLVDASTWRGARFMGLIAHEPYNGKNQHKIAQVSPYQLDGGKANDDQIPF